MRLADDVFIRIEIIKVLGQRESADRGIGGLLYDAQALFHYVKTGELTEAEQQTV
jgi:hypothetical protein